MSSSKARRGHSGRILLVLVMVLGLAFSALPVLGQDAGLYEVPDSIAAQIAADKAEKPYVVMMAGSPAVAYEGDIQGYKATKPAKDNKINPNSGAVKRYTGYLNDQHAGALNGVGVGLDKRFADYNISFNGFAAMLTGAEAAALLGRDDVLMVWEDELRKPTTDLSPEYLDMASLWSDAGLVGEDVIVGVIDTGIWPENPSFSDQVDLGDLPGNKNGKKFESIYAYDAPANWYGTCQSGEQWSRDDCNNKLIGATYFVEGFGKRRALHPGEYLSPRDWDGHGSHTASTAAGNEVTGDFGTISGMAPRAYVAMYKACWNSDLGGCATSDLVAAIDTAVADGVDVINYSIGSAAQSLWGPDELAFLYAADAGVFVATSNGNAGPGANTTGSPSSIPWVTSVGATNHREWLGTATLGDGSVFAGASLADPSGTGAMPLVDAANHANPLCYPEIAFDPPIEGNAVVCWRGDIARVAKSQAVHEQGGIGMILANVPGGAASTNADVHSVPSIHVDAGAGADIADYVVNDPAPTVDIAGQLGGVGAVAGFSSRGLGASSDLIKPDIAAPGVSVLAADAEVTFYGYNPTGVTSLSGTSMASPHIAGIGALVVEAHPDWTPAQVKSAMMTTADASATYGDDGASPATPFDTGSGLVQPGSALDPGLTYDAGFLDYVAFLCGNVTGAVSDGFCALLAGLGYPFDGSDLNQPNIAIGEMAGSQTVTRTVTNVSGGTHTYNISVDAPAGVDVTVDPASLTVDPGASATYEVTFTANESATIGEYAFGTLTWSHGPHAVTSQLAIRPVQAAFPGSVHGSGETGSLSFNIDFGYTGDYTAASHGLVPASMEDGNVVDDPGNDYNGFDGVTSHFLSVPAGSAFARFSLFDDYTDGADDLDLYVYGPNPTFDATVEDPGDPDFYPFVFVGGSGSGTSAEEVNVLAPEAGNADFVAWVADNLTPGVTHIVDVHGWQTDGPDSNYTLFWWAFGASLGNMTVTGPASATLGTTEAITVDWAGLDAGEMYLGAVSHSDAGGIFGMTLVEIDS